MLEETKSNWACVTEFMKNQDRIVLDAQLTKLFFNEPQKIFQFLSYYKFAAKMVGKNGDILEVGSKNGFGALVLSKECRFVKGIDQNQALIESARANFSFANLEFEVAGFFDIDEEKKWDAVIDFGSSFELSFFAKLKRVLSEKGMFICGSTSNIESLVRLNFEFIFVFSGLNGTVHLGSIPNADQYIILGCKKK